MQVRLSHSHGRGGMTSYVALGGAGLNAHWLAGEVVSRETDSGSVEMLCLAATMHGKDATEAPPPPEVAANVSRGTPPANCRGLEL